MSKDRKAGLPPGVSLGRDFNFAKPHSIEAQGTEWAAKIRADGGAPVADLLLLEIKNADFLSFPVLGVAPVRGKDTSFISCYYPRYNPMTGEVVITRRGSVKTEVNPQINKQRLVPPKGKTTDDFVVVNSEGLSGHSKNSFPKSWKVELLIPQKHKTVESALRLMDELKKDYSPRGVEQAQIIRVLGAFTTVADVITTEPEITQEVLSGLSLGLEELFVREGLIKPTSDFKRRILVAFKRAVRPDSLERVNPMISRIFARSGLLTATKQEMKVKFVKGKIEATDNILLIERFADRFNLKTAKEMLGALVGEGAPFPLSDVLTEERYRQNRRQINNEQIYELRDTLRLVDNVLQDVKLSPYLQPAVMARAMLLTGSSRTTREKLGLANQLKLIVTGNLLGDGNVERFIMARNPEPATDKILEIYDLIKGVLENPDNQVYETFSPRNAQAS